MGTQFSFLTYGLDEDFFFSAKTFILNELERIENKFSKFNEESEIFRINALAPNEVVKTDHETIALLSLCKAYYLKTNKLFDITVGKFTNGIRETGMGESAKDREPSGVTLNSENHPITGADKIILDFKESTVRFLNPMLSIDIGGIGKGYAIEKIQHFCTENQITNVLINFGDSSVSVLGSHPHGNYWPIGIQDAFLPGSTLHTFKLKNNSLSTSGNTPNNKIKFGDKGHIFNPLTGEFQRASKTVSVVTNSPVDAEVLSTTLFIATEEEKVEILSRFNPDDSIEISYNQMNDHKIVDLKNNLVITNED